MSRFRYFLDNWKLIIHLLFRTYYFGVNNQWWNSYRSIFGLHIWQRWNLAKQYRGIRFRAEIGFVPRSRFITLFSRYCKKYNIKEIKKIK